MKMMVWFMPWDYSLLAGFFLFLLAYMWLRWGNRSRIWRPFCFWAGWLSCYIVLLTHFNYYAEHSFFMGRIQHAVLQHVGSFMMALALPWRPSFRRGFMIWRALTHPVMAALMFDGLIVFWLVPSVHFLTMLDKRLYDLMNISMLLEGLIFWYAMFGSSFWRPVYRILALLSVIPVQIAVGAVLSFSPYPVYPVYDVCGRIFTQLSALQDQQIGALILWLHGAMTSMAGIAVIIWRDWRQPSVWPSFSSGCPSKGVPEKS